MKKFMEPAIEITKFEMEDVLTTSNTGSGGDDWNVGEEEL